MWARQIAGQLRKGKPARSVWQLGAASLPAPPGTQVRQQWRDTRGYEHFGGRGSYFSGGYGSLGSAAAGALALGGGVVYWRSREEIPYTQRKHAILVSANLERSLGTATFNSIREQALANGTLLPEHHPAVKAVRKVGMSLARVAGDGAGGGFIKHLQGLDWEFAVIDEDQANAFVVPGGKVVVFTGLMRLLRTDKELASVLAHEVAHVVARHAAERMTQAQTLTLLRTMIYWLFGLPIPSGALNLVLFLPNSRKAETEADVIGLRLAARACYDPSAAEVVFQRLEDLERRTGNRAVPAWLRTHPLTEDRIERVRRELPAALQCYHLAGCDAPQLRGFFSAATGLPRA